MKKLFSRMKRIIALLIVFGMVAGLVPAPVLGGIGAAIASAAEPDDRLELNKYCPFCRKHTVHNETK